MEELIDRLKRKEESAFKEVMDLYKNKIYNYLRMLVNNNELAEELTQDTFVKVYFKAHTLKTANLKAWIYTIATNMARSEFRKNKIKNLFSLSDVGEVNFSYNPSFEDDILVEQLISRLPDKYRIPLVMKELNNFSFDEISQILDKPVGTVKTLVFRGKNRLKEFVNASSDSSTAEIQGGTRKNVGNTGIIKASFNR